MAVNSSTTQLKTANLVSQGVPRKVRSLLTKTKYEAPKVISFPTNSMEVLGAMAYAGNL
jgi:hypothetical protein